MILRRHLSSSLPLVFVILLLLVGCGVKNPPEVPQDAGPEWSLPYAPLHGGGFRDGKNEVVVETPPPAYFPGAEVQAQPDGGLLTFPMPNQ